MKIHTYRPNWATLTLVASLTAAIPASAQVAGGSTTLGVSVIESTQIATGWSVTRTLLGKTIYNEAGQKVGKVADLIISPDRKVSYVIVGAGGFIGIGRHDVAIPVTQIQDQSGRLVMPGATKETIKSLPEFAYADDSARRDRVVAAADRDIADGKAKVAELEKKAGTVATDAKARIDLQIAALQVDLKSTEAKLTELKQATAVRWKEFEAGVRDATTRLRKSIDTAVG